MFFNKNGIFKSEESGLLKDFDKTVVKVDMIGISKEGADKVFPKN